MVRRRVVLSGAAPIASPSVVALASRALAAAAMPLAVVNNTGRYPDSAIYLYISAPTGRTAHRSVDPLAGGGNTAINLAFPPREWSGRAGRSRAGRPTGAAPRVDDVGPRPPRPLRPASGPVRSGWGPGSST
jgi:hypothetical protein